MSRGVSISNNEVSPSRYFTQYTGKGRYSVKCQISGDSDTGVNGGFIGARVFPKVPDPHSPLCCGSDAMPAGSLVTPTGNFTRFDPVLPVFLSYRLHITDTQLVEHSG